MPASDSRKEGEALHESVREVDHDKDREKDKSGKKGPSKTKDLSHVPCKFFKVGSCTAGSSCPFSHTVLEPGQQKEVCAWFVKGNCKFGHKCALAHILPGQSMSMDRKNKKAAQLAANASNTGGSGGRDSSRGGGRAQKGGSHNGGNGGPQSRNTLLSGSTAPTRAISNNSRSTIPMPLKATLSPSTPAPPVKDTEFASFGLPDESNKLPSAPAQGKPIPVTSADPITTPQNSSHAGSVTVEEPYMTESTVPSPLPVGTPTAPRRTGVAQLDSPSTGNYGPIGSPPHSSPSAIRPARINGFSPGSSPQPPGLSTSPFSAPGSQSVFVLHDQDDSSNGFKSRSGLSASLGAMMNWSTDRQSRRIDGMGVGGVASDIVVEDEDLEEFLPSSLTDLLTPEERSRRLSRTNAARPNMIAAERDAAIGQRPVGEGHHHRYSRSVPAPSLLQDIRSIWADNGGATPGVPELGGPGTSVISGASGGLGNGTPSSFQSNSGLTGRVSGEDMLAPSNASAAFLPGLHHHYLHAKAQRSNLLSGMTSLHSTGTGVSHNLYQSPYGAGLNAGALSPPHTSITGSHTLDHSSSDVYYTHTSLRASGRPIPGGNDGVAPDVDDRRNGFSPSARALQAHAPGQSLPQGLAAGYSRIHALPPPPVIPSPSTPGAFSQAGGFSPGPKVFGHIQSASGDWYMSPSTGNSLDHLSMTQAAQTSTTSSASIGGLEAVFSRLSYSAAASRGVTGSTAIAARNTGGRNYNPQGSLSPLSGPVLTGDDDDLFSMDG